MNRRSFLKSTAAASALTLLRPPRAFAAVPQAKITKISFYQAPSVMPLQIPLLQSNMVVVVETDVNITGIGEGGTLDSLIPCAGRLIGKNPFEIGRIWQDMYRAFHYPPGRERLHAMGALDLALWGYGYVVPGGVKTVAEVAAQAEAPPTDAGASLHAPETLRPDWLLLSNFRIARPYVGLHPFRQLQLTSASELQVSGVEWLQTPDGWHKLADPLPRVRIVPERLITNDAVSALSLIDIRRVAIVDGELPLLDPRATAELVADSSGKIIADVFSGGYALLTTTEAYHSGWKASTDDGRELGTIRVYGDYLGVLVASGRYRLTLSFKPRSIVLGAYLSLGGLALTAGLAIAVRGVGRRASHS